MHSRDPKVLEAIDAGSLSTTEAMPFGSKMGSAVVFNAARAADPLEKRTRHVNISIPQENKQLNGEATASPSKMLPEETVAAEAREPIAWSLR